MSGLMMKKMRPLTKYKLTDLKAIICHYYGIDDRKTPLHISDYSNYELYYFSVWKESDYINWNVTYCETDCRFHRCDPELSKRIAKYLVNTK